MEDTFFEVPDNKMARFLPNHILDPQTGGLMDVSEVPADNPLAAFFKSRKMLRWLTMRASVCSPVAAA